MTNDHNEIMLLVAREQMHKLEAFKMDEKTLIHRVQDRRVYEKLVLVT